MVSLSVGLLTLISGIYLYPHLQLVRDLSFIFIGFALFYVFKKLGFFEFHPSPPFPDTISGLGREINVYMLFLGAFLLFLLFNSL